MTTIVKPTLSDEDFEALKAKHGAAVCVLTAAGAAAFRCPTRDECRELMKELGGTRKQDAQERIVQECVIFPKAEDFDAMVERKPGIVSACINPLLELAGMEANAPYQVVPHPTLDEVVIVTTKAAGDVTLRCPTRMENKAYEDESEDPKKKGEAIDRLVIACVVTPAEFPTLLGKKPGLTATCFNAVRRLAGVEESAIVKK